MRPSYATQYTFGGQMGPGHRSPPMYPMDGLPPKPDFHANVNVIGRGGAGSHRPYPRGSGRARGRDFQNRHQQPPNLPIHHQYRPAPYNIPPSMSPMYHYPPPNPMNGFPGYPSQPPQVAYPYPPNVAYPHSTSIHEHILRSPEADQSNAQQFVPQTEPPISAPEEPLLFTQSHSQPPADQIPLDSPHIASTIPLNLESGEGIETPAMNGQSALPDLTESLEEPRPKEEWIISRFRPDDPADAFGITISPNARPPSKIVLSAVDYHSPLRSKKVLVKKNTAVIERAVPKAEPEDTQLQTQEEPLADVQSTDISPSSAEPISSSATETESGASTAPDAFVPGSPLSTNTSISVALTKDVSAIEAIAAHENSVVDTNPPSPSVAPVSEVVPSPSTEDVALPSPIKKSWASLLQTSGNSANQLPTSKVVGFSVPASSEKPSNHQSASASGHNNLSRFLAAATGSGPLGGGPIPAIRPRGLVNTGNMCFANAVLQVLVYCPPFYRFFTDLGKHIESNTFVASKATPLVEALVTFLKEFGPRVRDHFTDGYGSDSEFDGIDSFIPSYIYDAMKEKSRFDNMGVSECSF